MEHESSQLSDAVVFELPAYADVEALRARLRPRWPGRATRAGDVWFVHARVRADATDLGSLLRAVEAYVAAAGLLALRYSVDGRFYIVEARAPDVAVAA
jgi:hypothetical protein